MSGTTVEPEVKAVGYVPWAGGGRYDLRRFIERFSNSADDTSTAMKVTHHVLYLRCLSARVQDTVEQIDCCQVERARRSLGTDEATTR
jgi:hypothetical protein